MKEIVRLSNGNEIEFECNAYTPIAFKEYTGRDLLQGVQNLKKKDPDVDLMTNLAFVMATQAGFEGTIKDFLSKMDLGELYNVVLPPAMDLWKRNTQTNSMPKKDHDK